MKVRRLHAWIYKGTSRIIKEKDFPIWYCCHRQNVNSRKNSDRLLQVERVPKNFRQLENDTGIQ